MVPTERQVFDNIFSLFRVQVRVKKNRKAPPVLRDSNRPGPTRRVGNQAESAVLYSTKSEKRPAEPSTAVVPDK